MFEEKSLVAPRAFLDLSESFLRNINDYQESAKEILPILLELGESELVKIFSCFGTFLANKIMAESYAGLDEMTLVEIAFYQNQVNSMLAWMRFSIACKIHESE